MRTTGTIAGSRAARAIALAVCALAMAPMATAQTAAAKNRAPTIESKDKALAAALLRVTIAPSAEAYDAVGHEYTRLGLLDQAYEQFSAAIALNARDAEAYEMRARIWRDWGFPSRGMADAARAAYYAPYSPAAHNTWGTVLAATGRMAQARREFQRSLAIDPNAAYALTNMCYVAFESGDVPGAIATCRQAVATDPASVVARNNLALSLAAAGDYTEAEEQFRTAGGAMTGRFNTGLAYLAAGRFAQAQAAFDAVTPGHPLAARARARSKQARAAAAASADVAAHIAGAER